MKYLILVLAIFTSAFTATAQNQPAVLPNVAFYKANGSTFSTTQFPKNKKSLIIFFDATCPHCQRVVANLAKENKKLSQANLYLVSQDEFRSINYFMNNFGKPLLTMKNVTVLKDSDMAFVPLFHPRQYPSLYLYGPDRRLIYYSSDERDVTKFLSLIKS
jgi:thioredoxin-related protein